jgi:glycosyltransferase involved in cell wall biosynthesis
MIRNASQYPTLTELPPPPPGKVGWPWTEESPNVTDTRLDGKPWPRISIITPSYNQAQFLEQTIRSVLLQGYPNLEYIIIDGGSIDGSIDIIKKYEPWLFYWVSETDNGQSDAINKGWSRATGEILAWINSDDSYEINALKIVAEYFMNHDDVDMVYGDCNIIDEAGQFMEKCPTMDFDFGALVCNKWFISQQSTFVRRKVLETIGGLKEDLHLVLDWELWLRIALNGFRIVYLRHTLANFRIWTNAKTSSMSERSGEEKIMVLNDLFRDADLLPKIYPFKKVAYYRVYRFAGIACYRNNHRKKTLLYLLKSIRYCPAQLKEKDIIKILICSVLGLSRIRRLKEWYSYLAKVMKA